MKGTAETEVGLLVTHIPYSACWTTLVDGVEVDTEKVNRGFIGIPLSTGNHTIEFIYETPFLTIGLFLTFADLIGLLILLRQSSKKDN